MDGKQTKILGEKMKKTVQAACFLGSIALLTLGSSSPAIASTQSEYGSTITDSTYVQECLDKVRQYNLGANNEVSPETCAISVTTTIGERSPVSDKTAIPASVITDLSSAEKDSLLTAAAAGQLQSQHWSQFTTGGGYTRTQNGTMFFNGAEVWVTETRYGYTGSHACFTNYAVQFNISDRSCSEEGGPDYRILRDVWNVNPNGLPFSYDVSMTATVRANGSIEGFGSTVG